MRQTTIVMGLLLTLVFTGIFLLAICRLPFFRIEGISFKVLGGIFLLKVVAGMLLFMVYTYYYTDRSEADIFKYFDDSKVMYDALKDKPADYLRMLTGIGNDSRYFNETYYDQMNNWYRQYETETYNDNHTVIRFNAFVRLFSMGYYPVHNVCLNFLSFIGLAALYKFFLRHLPYKGKELMIAVFLLPSVLFWGSGLLKEGIVLFGLGMLLLYFDRLITARNKLLPLLWVFLSVMLLKYTKVYILLIMSPLLISYYWSRSTGGRNAFIKYAVTLFVFFLAALNIHHILPDYDLLSMLVRKQRDFIGLAHHTGAGSLIRIPLLKPTLASLALNAPVAFLITLFRPFFFEAFNFFIILAGLENLVVYYLCGVAVWFRQKRKKEIDWPLLWLCAFFVLMLFTLTGLITPVMGAIVRYKVPAWPFFMVCFIIIMNKNRFLGRFPCFRFLR